MRALWLLPLLVLVAGCAGVIGPESDAPAPMGMAPALPNAPLVAVLPGKPWALRMTFAPGGGSAMDRGMAKEARRSLITGIVAFARGTARWAAAAVGIAQEGADSFTKGTSQGNGTADNIWGAVRDAVASGRVVSIEVVGTAEEAKP